MREAIKTGCALGLYWSNLDTAIGALKGADKAPLVIGYHRVVEDFQHSAKHSIAPQLTSTLVFEKQLEWISRRYEIVSLDSLVNSLTGEEIFKKPVAAITFDDGYSDIYRNALPVLVRKGFPAAVFVVSNLVGSKQLLAHDELYLLLSLVLIRGKSLLLRGIKTLSWPSERLGKLTQLSQSTSDSFLATRAVLRILSQTEVTQFINMLRELATINDDLRHEFQLLDWPMLQSMVAQGFTVGSHSKSHALLAKEPPAMVKEELEGSRSTLEQRLGVPIRHFAYPDGLFDTNAVQATSVAGYRSAYTTCNHQDKRYPLLTIPRKMLWEHSSIDIFGHFSAAILRCQVNGIFDPATKCQLQHFA